MGKSDFAVNLAQQYNGEIINGDLGQFYTPLSIGTAKPDLVNQSVPHHLFNIFDKPYNYTVTMYREDVMQVMNKIWSRNKIPLIVGGSTFYMSSLFFPPLNFEKIDLNPEIQKIIANSVWETLYKIDPVRALEINKGDEYRIKRAMTIWFQTGKKPSLLKPLFSPLAPTYFISLSRERNELNNRINSRTKLMLTQGWIDEATCLLDTQWEPFVREKGFIGYEEIFNYLRGLKTKSDYNKLIGKIQQKTRFYAKRQITYWRMLERKLLSSKS